jgi:hypothetical protein
MKTFWNLPGFTSGGCNDRQCQPINAYYPAKTITVDTRTLQGLKKAEWYHARAIRCFTPAVNDHV